MNVNFHFMWWTKKGILMVPSEFINNWYYWCYHQNYEEMNSYINGECGILLWMKFNKLMHEKRELLIKNPSFCNSELQLIVWPKKSIVYHDQHKCFKHHEHGYDNLQLIQFAKDSPSRIFHNQLPLKGKSHWASAVTAGFLSDREVKKAQKYCIINIQMVRFIRVI